MFQIWKIKWRNFHRENNFLNWRTFLNKCNNLFSKTWNNFPQVWISKITEIKIKNFLLERGDILNHAPLMINCNRLSMHQKVSRLSLSFALNVLLYANKPIEERVPSSLCGKTHFLNELIILGYFYTVIVKPWLHQEVVIYVYTFEFCKFLYQNSEFCEMILCTLKALLFHKIQGRTH